MVESPVLMPFMYGVVLFFEVVGVLVILGGFSLAVVRSLRVWRKARGGVFDTLRATFGRSILLGLEVLIAADLVRTITMELTVRNIVLLAALIGIRTFLSFSLEVEIDGRWPWRRSREAA